MLITDPRLEDMYETDELWEAECEKASQLAEKLSGLLFFLPMSLSNMRRRRTMR